MHTVYVYGDNRCYRIGLQEKVYVRTNHSVKIDSVDFRDGNASIYVNGDISGVRFEPQYRYLWIKGINPLKRLMNKITKRGGE